jgi:hypothetical protein
LRSDQQLGRTSLRLPTSTRRIPVAFAGLRDQGLASPWADGPIPVAVEFPVLENKSHHPRTPLVCLVSKITPSTPTKLGSAIRLVFFFHRCSRRQLDPTAVLQSRNPISGDERDAKKRLTQLASRPHHLLSHLTVSEPPKEERQQQKPWLPSSRNRLPQGAKHRPEPRRARLRERLRLRRALLAVLASHALAPSARERQCLLAPLRRRGESRSSAAARPAPAQAARQTSNEKKPFVRKQ